MDKKKTQKIFDKFYQHNNDPKIELFYLTDFTLLVAVVLSAQSTDKGVNKVTESFFKKINTPKQMVDLGLSNLKEEIKTIGLYNSKAKNIIKMSEILVQKYNSKVPNKFEDLISLPGVGRKSANVVLNTLFNQPTIGVDTHVHRVSNRIGLVSTKTPEQTEKGLLCVVPKKNREKVHHWLVLHGRYTCKARKPLCKNCLISDYCDYDLKSFV